MNVVDLTDEVGAVERGNNVVNAVDAVDFVDAVNVGAIPSGLDTHTTTPTHPAPPHFTK